jgi:hypothetical protein
MRRYNHIYDGVQNLKAMEYIAETKTERKGKGYQKKELKLIIA